MVIGEPGTTWASQPSRRLAAVFFLVAIAACNTTHRSELKAKDAEAVARKQSSNKRSVVLGSRVPVVTGRHQARETTTSWERMVVTQPVTVYIRARPSVSSEVSRDAGPTMRRRARERVKSAALRRGRDRREIRVEANDGDHRGNTAVDVAASKKGRRPAADKDWKPGKRTADPKQDRLLPPPPPPPPLPRKAQTPARRKDRPKEDKTAKRARRKKKPSRPHDIPFGF